MKLSYDYTEFLQEMKEEIEDGMVTLESVLRVRRADEPIDKEGYRPIIDWYYDEETMKGLLEECENEQEKRMCLGYLPKEDYKLEYITVKDMIIEMDKWNRLF